MVRTALFGKPIFELVYTYRLAAGIAVQRRVLPLLLSLFFGGKTGQTRAIIQSVELHTGLLCAII